MNTRALDAYVGVPYALHGRGPDRFDCWQLTRSAARALYGLCFPDLCYHVGRRPSVAEAAAGALETGNWTQLDGPVPGAVLALVRGGVVTHCALCLDAERALHTCARLGAHIAPIATLVAQYEAGRFYAWTR